jgi:hypothetical protein
MVLVLRLVVPLSIVRWPFWGTLATLLADGVDIIIFQLTASPGDEYQRFDKLLDVYYILVQFAVAQGWPSPERWVLNALFAYRMIGTLAFEVGGKRELLVFFPNVFTFYFVLLAGLLEFRPTYKLNARRSAAWLTAIIMPTLLLEYSLHWAQWFDQWRAVDIIEAGGRAVINLVTPWPP